MVILLVDLHYSILRMKHRLIFKAVVGSQAYGLQTPTSDTDIKGVYIQDYKDLLQAGTYEPFIMVNKDECYYELRNFLELLAAGNPTAIELLATPENCVLETSPEFEEILKHKHMFITQKLYDSFGGYALAQIKKAQGLNKKFNWEQSRIDKKDVLDFCKVLDRYDGKPMPVKEWLAQLELDQSKVGLSKVDGFRDTYKIHAQPGEGIIPLSGEEAPVYRGIMKEESNEVRTSAIPKRYVKLWLGLLYFNVEAYSTHCRDYKSYKKWLESRNEARYKESREGQQYDSKNIMHTARLIMTIEDIHDTGRLNIDMTNRRDELLDIKFGKVDLEKVFGEYSKRASEISKLKADSTLIGHTPLEFTRQLELKIREWKSNLS